MGHRHLVGCLYSYYRVALLMENLRRYGFDQWRKEPRVKAQEFKHCDDYIDDESQPQVLRTFLEWHRSPASTMMKRREAGQIPPKLFASFKGERYRVTMASTLGDVGISRHHQQEYGYHARMPVEWLTDFSETP